MALKKLWKKTASILLVATMVLGLCACGENKTDDGGKGGKDSKGVNSELAKQFVYKEEALDLSALGSENDYYIAKMQKIGDILYVLASYNQYKMDGTSLNYFKLLSMNTDGSNSKVIDLLLPGQVIEDIPEEEITGEGAGDAVVLPMPRAEVSSKVMVETEVAVEDVVTEDVAVEDAVIDVPADDFYYEPSTSYEYSGYGQSVIAEDGMVYAVRNHTIEDWSDPENYISKSDTTICCWDKDGNFVWEAPIEGLQTEEHWYYVQNMMPQKEGGVTLLLSGDKVCKIDVDKTGKATEMKPLSEDLNSTFNNAQNIMIGNDGKIVFTYYDQEWTNMYMATYDPATGAVSEGVKLPSAMQMMGYSNMATGENGELIYSNSSGVFKFTPGQEEATQIMSYINSDLNVSDINQMVYLDESHMILTYYDNYEYKMHCGYFTKVDPKDIPDKDVIVLAGNWIDYNLKNRVIEYNKTSDKYRIVVKEYQMYSTNEDYMAGYTRLNNDIIAGNIPDIMIADNSLPIENYISKGILADVGKLIAEDEELSKSEFMENVFEAYKIDGKLYQVIPSFYVQTVIGKKSNIGDRKSWTMKEMRDVVEGFGEGTQAFGEMTRDSFMYYVMNFGSSDFVDVANGKCNFNSQQFIDILEYAKTLPEQISEDYYDDENWWMTYQSQYRDNRTLLMYLYISDFQSMKYQINGYMGDDVSYVGFPTDTGNGSVLGADTSYVISAKSKCLDGAWDFVRYYLTDEYQIGDGQNVSYWGLPVSKKAFFEKAKDVTCKSYWVDEEGKKQEYDDYFSINGEEIVIEPLSQAQYDEMVNFIQSVTKRSYYNEELQKIVTEGVEPFFAGQKSAADVAKIIQSRAQVYVNENM